MKEGATILAAAAGADAVRCKTGGGPEYNRRALQKHTRRYATPGERATIARVEVLTGSPGGLSPTGGHMKYQKILLAYNGSQEGKRALFECAELAEFHHAEVHLLAVASMPPSLFLTEGFVPEELLEEEKKRTQTVLNEGIQSLTTKGFKAAGHLAVGEPVEEICRSAKELGVDLI